MKGGPTLEGGRRSPWQTNALLDRRHSSLTTHTGGDTRWKATPPRSIHAGKEGGKKRRGDWKKSISPSLPSSPPPPNLLRDRRRRQDSRRGGGTLMIQECVIGSSHTQRPCVSSQAEPVLRAPPAATTNPNQSSVSSSRHFR